MIVGLDGDTDAVLWNEELRMLTAVGELEKAVVVHINVQNLRGSQAEPDLDDPALPVLPDF